MIYCLISALFSIAMILAIAEFHQAAKICLLMALIFSVAVGLMVIRRSRKQRLTTDQIVDRHLANMDKSAD